MPKSSLMDRLGNLAKEAENEGAELLAGILYAILGSIHGGPNHFRRFVEGTLKVIKENQKDLKANYPNRN